MDGASGRPPLSAACEPSDFHTLAALVQEGIDAARIGLRPISGHPDLIDQEVRTAMSQVALKLREAELWLRAAVERSAIA